MSGGIDGLGEGDEFRAESDKGDHASALVFDQALCSRQCCCGGVMCIGDGCLALARSEGERVLVTDFPVLRLHDTADTHQPLSSLPSHC
jgi:hypothetical protein